MPQLARCQLQHDGCGQTRAFLCNGINAFFHLAPHFASLLLRDVVGCHALGLNQQIGNLRQLFFAMPSLEFFQGLFGLSGLGVCEVDVVVEPPRTDLGQLVVAQFDSTTAT